ALIAILFSTSLCQARMLPAAWQQVMPLQSEKDDPVREYEGTTPSGKEDYSDYRSGYDDYERAEGDADNEERGNSYPMENEDAMLSRLGLVLSGGDATLMDSTQQQTKPAKPENSSRKLKRERRQTSLSLASGRNSNRRYRRTTICMYEC
ncbi:unnamed protein product, partial [Darwinula stevensoni]